MKNKFHHVSKYFMALFVAVAIAGCFKILNIVQASSATKGEQITSTVTVSVEGTSDPASHHGIVGVLVPNDWSIDSVYFTGGYSDYCTFLDPDSSDAEPGGQVDYWADSLEARYPSGAGMKWMVYQSSQAHAVSTDTVDVAISVVMTVGQTDGNYKLGYFVSDAALDFTDPSYYSVSLDNSIQISGVVPVELTSFTVNTTKEGVQLNWKTATETNNSGFEIQRSADKGNYKTIGFVKGAGTSTQFHNYSYMDKSVSEGNYSYRLKQVDLNGQFEYSKVVEVAFSVPADFELAQNYPNPFNPSTSISFGIPTEARVVIKVFNIQGKELATVANNNYSAGRHIVSFDAANFASGTYIYTLNAVGKDGNNFVQSKKMVLLK